MHLDNMEQIQKRVLEDMDLSEENDDARLKEKIEEKVWEYGKEHLDLVRRRTEICAGNLLFP